MLIYKLEMTLYKLSYGMERSVLVFAMIICLCSKIRAVILVVDHCCMIETTASVGLVGITEAYRGALLLKGEFDNCNMMRRDYS